MVNDAYKKAEYILSGVSYNQTPFVSKFSR